MVRDKSCQRPISKAVIQRASERPVASREGGIYSEMIMAHYVGDSSAGYTPSLIFSSHWQVVLMKRFPLQYTGCKIATSVDDLEQRQTKKLFTEIDKSLIRATFYTRERIQWKTRPHIC